MNAHQSIQAFAAYSPQEKGNFLLYLAHELTIVARETYETDAEGLVNPARLRALNEIQHRVLSALIALTQNNLNRYPDEVLMNIILDHPEDIELQHQIADLFDRLLSQVVA